MNENNEDIVFNSLQELYIRLKPALLARVSELHRNGFNYITEEDIWNYFKENKWKRSNNLNLHEMVSDIFNCDEILVDDYVKGKLNQKNRTLYFDDNSEDDKNEE